MSVQQGTTEGLNIKVQVLNLGFTDATDPIASGNPVTLHTGGQQGTYAIDCSNNGASTFDDNMAVGCAQAFATTTQPNPPICANQPPGPAVCVNQDPGTGKQVEPGVDCRVNGVMTFTAGKGHCAPSNTCTSPNYWTSPNTLNQILHEHPADPRLVTLLIVDSDAWVGVTGTSYMTPVREIATFYITGWSRTGKGGDPCTSPSSGTAVSSNGLTYVQDDNPGSASNVLLGHFVMYTIPGNGNGSPCSPQTFGDCVPVLTK
jgi:hypothetical protein